MHRMITQGPRAILIIALSVSLSACFSEHTTLPSEDVSFAADVQPLLNGSCASSNCHGSNANPSQKPMVLQTGQAYDAIVGVPSEQLPAMPRITPGQPNQSYLIHKLEGTHDGVGGAGSRMPLGQPPLAQAIIDLVRQWVTDGAPRN